MTWQQSDGFIEGDVIRWTEAIWAPNKTAVRRRKTAHKRPWGKQEVTAQIIAIEGDFVSLKILKAEIKEKNVGTELRPHKIGAVIKKKKQTLLKGNPERLHWSEESVRSVLVSNPPSKG